MAHSSKSEKFSAQTTLTHIQLRYLGPNSSLLGKTHIIDFLFDEPDKITLTSYLIDWTK